jgi:hypothetical protein
MWISSDLQSQEMDSVAGMLIALKELEQGTSRDIPQAGLKPSEDS